MVSDHFLELLAPSSSLLFVNELVGDISCLISVNLAANVQSSLGLVWLVLWEFRYLSIYKSSFSQGVGSNELGCFQNSSNYTFCFETISNLSRILDST